LLQVIERFRDRGLQTPFTKEILAKAGVSDSLTPRVLQALRLLDFVDGDDNPTPALQEYARASTDDARSQLELMVRSAYEPIFAFTDPATDAPDRIRDAFRGYEPRGQQDRMVTLFIGLCQRAGIVPEQVENGAVARHGQRRSSKAAGRRSARGPVPKPKADGAVRPATAGMQALPAAVQGLLTELADIGPSWTRADRDRFMTVWNAVIDFSYPVREPTDADSGDDGM
jgi:hypothetical protein